MKTVEVHTTAKARRLVVNALAAADAYAFLGAAHPDAREEIEQDYVNAQIKLMQYIGELERKVADGTR